LKGGLVGIGELEAPEAALAAPALGAHAAAAVLAQLIAPAVGAGDVLLVYHVETKARIMPQQLLEYITLFYLYGQFFSNDILNWGEKLILQTEQYQS
jgi:hypothetical protein